MAYGVTRAAALVVLLVVACGLSVPPLVSARGAAQSLEATCTSYGHDLVALVYGGMPWQADAVEQRASPEYLQVMQGTSLATVMAPYANELGTLTEQSNATATITPHTTASGTIDTCTYQADGTFAHGTATVGMDLIQHNGEWQVLRWRMHDVVHPAS